jgi:hypothetical protein
MFIGYMQILHCFNVKARSKLTRPSKIQMYISCSLEIDCWKFPTPVPSEITDVHHNSKCLEMIQSLCRELVKQNVVLLQIGCFATIKKERILSIY